MINIVFGLDDKFAAMCGACCASILANHKRKVKSGELKIVVDDDDKIHFYFIGNLSGKNKKRLLDLKKIQDCECSFPEFDYSQFKRLPTNRFYRSQAMYLRLITPEILSVDKIIYLDCDIISNIDIQELWDFDLEGQPIAAVRTGFNADYFYSGLLIMDLKKLREIKFDTKWRDFAFSASLEKLAMPDQDILNNVLKGQVSYLPYTYNVTGDYYQHLLKNNLDREHIIVHYSPGKPLAMDCPPYLRKLYFKYSALTAWKENMTDFWIQYFRFYPGFWFNPKHWKRIKEMREKEKRGE